MSTVSYKSRDIGYMLQAAKGSEAITTAMYYFGAHNMPIGDFIDEEHIITPVHYELLEASELLINSKQVIPKVGYGAVNALPFYWFLGHAVDVGGTGNIQMSTISGGGGGDRPYLTIRDKIYNGSEYIARHSIDCQLHNLTFTYDIRSNPQCVYNLQFEGLSIRDDSDAVTISYPGAQDELYTHSQDAEFRWDMDGAGNIISGLISMSIGCMINKAPNKNHSSLFPIGFQDFEQIYSITVTFIAGATNTKELHDCFLAQDHATQSTFKEAQFEIYSTATKSMFLDIKSIAWTTPKYSSIEISKGTVPTVTFTGIFRSLEAGVVAADTVPLTEYDL